jgi:hypothetical protein
MTGTSDSARPPEYSPRPGARSVYLRRMLDHGLWDLGHAWRRRLLQFIGLVADYSVAGMRVSDRHIGTRDGHRLVRLVAAPVLVVGAFATGLSTQACDPGARARSQRLFEQRGQYIASNLGMNSEYSVHIEDATQLQDLIDYVRMDPDVVGVVIRRDGVVLAKTGAIQEGRGITVFRAPVAVFRVPVPGDKPAARPEAQGSVEVALQQSERTPREELDLFGRYMARTLAINAEYGVMIADPTQLTDLVEATRNASPDVAGVAVHDIKGKRLAHSGEPARLPSSAIDEGGIEAQTETGKAVILYRVPVITSSRLVSATPSGTPSGSGPRDSGWRQIGEVQVAFHPDALVR